MKKKKLPIGIEDFSEMITGNYYYVDKTLFIQEIIDSDDKVLLIPRPRRFGKTLNLSMLKYFYDCCPANKAAHTPTTGNTIQNNYKELFTGLAIMQTAQEYLDKLGQYPVIFLSFKNIKDNNWELCYESIKSLLQQEYARHDYLAESPKLMPHERQFYHSIITKTGNQSDFSHSLEQLLIFLNRFYEQRVVILIDEYDAPIHAGFNYGYYDEIVNFIRIFMSGGLKDTSAYLEKGVITGIMRIARESIFSDLNNLGVYTLLAEDFREFFGFTETEIKTILEDFQVMHLLSQVQAWYNGYNFGGRVIYNPWSILNLLRDRRKELKPYWINTSDNNMVDVLLSRGDTELREELEQLVNGEAIEKAIEEPIILKDITTEEDSLWSFLLMGGYLKQTAKKRDPGSGRVCYFLSIPNEEVKYTYVRIIRRYFSTKIENKKLEIMLKALLEGDIHLFEKMLQAIVLAVFSYHDFGNEPEKVYHALVAGLLIWISNTHEIKSNRESGYGRYDIMIIPKNPSLVGYVIEFKSVDVESNETIEAAIEAALVQIEVKRYETELVSRGITRIKKLAIAFLGKKVVVKEAMNN